MSDRTPPFDKSAEQAVLGSVLLRPSALGECIEAGMQPDDFYVPAHSAIYEAMLGLFEVGQAVDAVALAHELEKRGRSAMTGGLPYLGDLHAMVPTSENIAYYQRIVMDCSTLRKLVARASGICERAYTGTDDAAGSVEEAERSIFELTRRTSGSRIQSAAVVLRDTAKMMAARAGSPSHVTGVPCGFADIDRHTGGFQPSDLVVLAARPSVGKTSFAINAAVHAASAANMPVLIFSLEMASHALGERMLCAQARVDGLRTRTGRLSADEWGRVSAAGSPLSRAPIWIDDGATLTVGEIRAKARRWRSDRHVFTKDRPLGLVVVDYLQLVRAGERLQSREQEVAAVSRGMKALAKETGLPVLALSQLNRAVEERTDGRPRLSDLRESGSLEQDSDVVLFLSRPHGDDPVSRNRVRVDGAKQRNGPVFDAELIFMPEHTRFEPAAREGWGT